MFRRGGPFGCPLAYIVCRVKDRLRLTGLAGCADCAADDCSGCDWGSLGTETPRNAFEGRCEGDEVAGDEMRSAAGLGNLWSLKTALSVSVMTLRGTSPSTQDWASSTAFA